LKGFKNINSWIIKMYNYKEIEEEVRKIWNKNEKEIKKTVQNDPKKPLFSFLEGPPTANAPPGLHHLEVRTFKDIICKFKYMNGFSVPRKGGWDTHGLPVEVQIEKKLGLNSKKDVIKYGTDKFINECRESVFSNINIWNKSTEELGYFIDLENAYVTLKNEYMESVWWSLKELYKKGYLYEGYKVVPFCPRCETPLSSHEVAQGYKDIKEESVYIAFKVKNRVGEYILAWTTTPWTLPGNVALAVGKDIDYVKVKLSDGDFVILGKDRLNVLRGEYEILENFKGEDLVGIEYEPLFEIKELKNENSYKIILANFVTTVDGTGIVHTAGMYGEDDYNVCKEYNLPLIHTVEQDGKFNSLVTKWQGKFVKDVEEEIKLDLKKRHLLYKTEKTNHAYPFCWRCDSPLLYYAINSWFIKVSSFNDKLVEKNKEINWYPDHIKDGRFGKWLEGAKDWALSRFKFWGTPLPIWRCECGYEEAIGSIEELKERSIKKISGNIDLHKPWIDEIKLKCKKCNKEMKRIPDVIDCWYDSGSASFAQFHYPFENKDIFSKRYPYDFISEAIDQTRGWFYTLHVLGVLLFDKPVYKNVICAGHIVDDKGEKMSKTKGNIIKPNEIIEKTGVDAVRLQFCTSDTGNFKRFSSESIKEQVIPFLTVLENCFKYYQQSYHKKLIKKIEDKWILSRLNSTINKVTMDLENYSIDRPFSELYNFVVNDFSRTYIKMTREREDTKEILGEVLKKVSLLIAPYAPYISDYIYKDFDKRSVHLSIWPKADKKLIDEKLDEDFKKVLEIIEKGLNMRDKAQIGLKWPLAKAIIKAPIEMKKEYENLIKNQLNIKSIEIKNNKEIEPITVELDTKLTLELEAEGFAREISRKVQDSRKKCGFVKSDFIKLGLKVNEEFKKIIEKNKEFIKERTNSKEILIGKVEEKAYNNKFVDKIKGKNIEILFNKI
jgi:isoleucyl-tRNA synthetase